MLLNHLGSIRLSFFLLWLYGTLVGEVVNDLHVKNYTVVAFFQKLFVVFNIT